MEALGIARRVHGERHPVVASLLHIIAKAMSEQGLLDDALKACEKAGNIHREALGRDNPETAEVMMLAGFIYATKEDNGEAFARFEEALGTFVRAGGDVCEGAARCRITL